MPTSCPYMVKLYKFYETSSTIYLLLQYASGGKLWDYVGAYLQQAQNHNKGSGPGGANHGYPGQKLQNVYTGYKIHTHDNKVTPTGSFANDQNIQDSVIENISANNGYTDSDIHEVGKLDNQVRFSKHSEDINLDLNSDDFQFDRNSDIRDDDNPVITDLELEITRENGIDSDIIQEQCESDKKAEYHRYTSFSSEEIDESDISSPNPLERQNSQGLGQFQDILQKNKVTLENFSINSFDSGEGVPRIESGSGLSDHIEVIHEVNEGICDKENTVNDDDNVFDKSRNINMPVSDNHEFCSNSNEVSHSKADSITKQQETKHTDITANRDSAISISDNNDIIASAKELLKSVERTLSQVDGENDKIISSEVHSEDINAQTVSSEEKEKSDSNGFAGVSEPSIYDINRTPDTSVSQSDVNSQESSSDKSPTSRPQSLELTQDSVRNSGVQNPLSGSTITPGSCSHKSVSQSPSDTQARSTSSFSNSLIRLNSGDLSRSASSDSELKSPMKSRQRTISNIFEQLDLSAANPEQIRIPESFIKRWAAEIIVAVSRLHALGIVCR